MHGVVRGGRDGVVRGGRDGVVRGGRDAWGGEGWERCMGW